MKNSLYVLLFVVVFGVSVPSLGFTKEMPCQKKELETVYLSHTTSVMAGASFSEPREVYLKEIQKLADEMKLQSFSVTGHDVSAYRNSYTTEVYEYSMSFTLTFERNGEAVTKFVKELMPVSVSSSVMTQECM